MKGGAWNPLPWPTPRPITRDPAMGDHSTGPRFDRIRALGHGSTGRVELVQLIEPFGAYETGSLLALKEPVSSDPSPLELRALEREWELNADLSHSGLARWIHGQNTEQGPQLFFEYIPGLDLDTLRKDAAPLPEPQVRRLGMHLARGLAYLHEQGLAHRDIKLANARLREDQTPAWLDLGCAIRAGETCDQSGTLAYLAPERIRGQEPAHPADLFALGICLFQLATGSHPFQPSAVDPDKRLSDDPSAWLESIAHTDAPQASSLAPTVSPLMDACLEALLSQNPADRPDAQMLSEIMERGESSPWWRAQLSAGLGATRRVRVDATGRLPFVGRESELEELGLEFQRMQERDQGRIVWLRGEKGMGKSRFVSHFAQLERMGETPPLYLYGRCSALGAGQPGHPIRTLLRRWLHLPAPLPPGPREKRLLSELVDPETARSLECILDGAMQARATHSEPLALAEWLRQLATSTSVLVFLDDITFAGEESLRAVKLVAERMDGARLLLILGMREGELPTAPRAQEALRARAKLHAPVSTMRLHALDRRAIETFVQCSFHPSIPRHSLTDCLLDRSSGTPAALREIMHSLHVSGHLRAHRDDQGLELLIPVREIPHSRGLQALIKDRIAQCDPSDRRMLQRLAVVGGRIDPAFIAQAFPPKSSEEVHAALTRLEGMGWISSVGSRYRFARPALREEVYASLNRRRRQNLHAQAAAALQPNDVDPGTLAGQDTLAFQRAFHLHSARERAELLDLGPDLAARALDRAFMGRAHTLARWCLAALKNSTPSPALHLRLLEIAATAAHARGYRKDLEQWLDELIELDLDPKQQPGAVGRIYLLHGQHRLHTGQWGLARGMLRNADQLLAEGKDSRNRAHALVLLSRAQFEVGEQVASLRLARRALRCSPHPVTQVQANLCRARVSLLNGSLEHALALVDRSIAAMRRAPAGLGTRGTLAQCHLARARIYSNAGRERHAFAALSRARRWAQRSAEHNVMAAVLSMQGKLLLKANKPSEAEVVLREARLASQESGHRPGELQANLHLSVLLLEGGQEEAPALLRQTVLKSSEAGHYRAQALSLALLARYERQIQPPTPGSSADAYSKQAQDLADRGIELPDRIVIVATRALILRESGRAAQAHRLVEDLLTYTLAIHATIGDRRIRHQHTKLCRQLLKSALSAEGPVYPRGRVPRGSTTE